MMTLLPGQKLAGCYLLDHELDAGTENPVWIAQDEVLGKEVSLHFLPSEILRDASALEELRQEIKRNRPLIHPAILRVYDLVEGDGWLAVAMETFHGRSMAALLKQKGRFDVNDLDDWLNDICVALEEAHRVKLTHRDLAPDNLFVTETGRVLLAFFGIGRVVQDSLAKNSPATLGSSRFSNLSPQLLAGTPPSPSDDVYGLGALFFQLLAGRPVFEGGDIPAKIRHAIPPRLGEVRAAGGGSSAPVPPGWDNVIAACLNKSPDERPGRPAEIVSSIDAYVPLAPTPVSEITADPQESAETLTELPPPVDLVVADEEPATLVASIPESDVLPASVEDLPEPEKLEIVSEDPSERPPEPEVPNVEAILLSPTEPEPEPEAEVEQPAPLAVESAEIEENVRSVEAEPIRLEEVAAKADEPPSIDTEAPAAQSESEPTPAEPTVLPTPVSTPPAASAPPRPHPAQPHRYYEDEDAFSSILPKRFRFPAAVAAAAVLVLFLVNHFLKKPADQSNPTPNLATVDSSDRSELTSVKNSVTQPVATPEVAAVASESKPSVPSETIVVAAAATPKVTIPIVVPTQSAPGSSPERQLAEKSAALEKMKLAITDAEKSRQAKLQEQQAAAAAIAETQKALEEKNKAAAAAKKAVEQVVAVRTKHQEEQRAAETAAMAAQQLAAEKAKAAEDAKKALADFEAKNQEKLSAVEKTEAEIQTLQTAMAERQKAAESAGREAQAAESLIQQQTALVKQAEEEVAQLQLNASKNTEEARRQQAMDAEKRKLDEEISAMRALFEQKMKDIETRRRELEGGAASSTPKVAVPSGVEVKAPLPVGPAATPILVAKTEIPAAPVTMPPAPPPTPAPAAPSADGAANSLGLRFAPVGDVSFSVWQTRVKDFEAFAKAVNLKSTAWRGPGFRQGPDHPVVNVTWTEAIAFCKWLTEKERKEGVLSAGQFYRLPYDLEWSKAVGLPEEGGKTPESRDMGVPDVYPWGTEWPPTKGAGNYTGEETGSDVAIKGYDDGFAWTAPVGSFPPNKFGLFDMGGNVWQWCMDSWNGESKAKVLRGASWYNGALKLSLLSSCRIQAAPDSSTDNYGFRIVRATESVAAKPPKR